MVYFLFEILSGEYKGETFIVEADTKQDAYERAEKLFVGERLKCWGEMTEEESEMSGLDVY